MSIQSSPRTVTVADAKSIVSSRSLIGKPGKYMVKVTTVTPYTNPDRPNQVAIINFNSMTPYHAVQARKAFLEGDIANALNYNLSSSVRKNDYLPSKGEFVNIMVDHVPVKDEDGNPTDELALVVVSYTEIKAQSVTTKISASIFDLEEEDEPAVTTTKRKAVTA